MSELRGCVLPPLTGVTACGRDVGCPLTDVTACGKDVGCPLTGLVVSEGVSVRRLCGVPLNRTNCVRECQESYVYCVITEDSVSENVSSRNRTVYRECWAQGSDVLCF